VIDVDTADYFRRLHKVYSKYKGQTDSDLRSHNLLPARLLYGECEVAIRMEFLDNYRPVIERDLEDESKMEHVARAIVFLARQGLLYTDIKPQNFMISEENDVMLIDYDDMQIIEDGVGSIQELKEKIDGLEIPQDNNYMDEHNNWFHQFRCCLQTAFSQAS